MIKRIFLPDLFDIPIVKAALYKFTLGLLMKTLFKYRWKPKHHIWPICDDH